MGAIPRLTIDFLTNQIQNWYTVEIVYSVHTNRKGR